MHINYVPVAAEVTESPFGDKGVEIVFHTDEGLSKVVLSRSATVRLYEQLKHKVEGE